MKRAAFTILLVVVTCATFGAVITFDFVGWDDFDTIKLNDRLRPPSLSNVAYYWTHDAGGLYVPLTYTAWSAVAAIGQTHTSSGALELNPWIFHAANLVVHILSIIVVFDLLRLLLHRDGPALVGAMLFALHPFQVEPVAWASGLKDVLCGLFALLSLREYVRFASNQSGRAHYVMAIVFQVLAMLAKPAGVVVPLIAASLDILVLGRPLGRVRGAIIPMLLATIPCIVWSRLAQVSYPETYTPLWTRPLIAADALAFYLAKLVWPYPLAATYDRTPMAVVAASAMYYMWLIPAVVAIILVLNRKRWPMLLAAGAMFVAGLLPTLGFARFMMQIHSTVSDHYMYLPMLGAALAMAWAVSRWETPAVYASCGVVLALLAARSFSQAWTWHDSITLFSNAVRINPNSIGANGNLGGALGRAGRMEEAIPYLSKTAQLSPNNRVAQVMLAQALLYADHFEQAIEPAEQALLLAARDGDSDTAWEHFLLGRALSRLGRYREAEPHFAAAARQQPNDRNLAAELESVRQRLDSPTTSQ